MNYNGEASYITCIPGLLHDNRDPKNHDDYRSNPKGKCERKQGTADCHNPPKGKLIITLPCPAPNRNAVFYTKVALPLLRNKPARHILPRGPVDDRQYARDASLDRLGPLARIVGDEHVDAGDSRRREGFQDLFRGRGRRQVEHGDVSPALFSCRDDLKGWFVSQAGSGRVVVDGGDDGGVGARQKGFDESGADASIRASPHVGCVGASQRGAY